MKDKDFVVDPHRKRQEREDILTGIMNPCEKAQQNRLACEGYLEQREYVRIVLHSTLHGEPPALAERPDLSPAVCISER